MRANDLYDVTAPSTLGSAEDSNSGGRLPGGNRATRKAAESNPVGRADG